MLQPSLPLSVRSLRSALDFLDAKSDRWIYGPSFSLNFRDAVWSECSSFRGHILEMEAPDRMSMVFRGEALGGN